MNHSLAVAFIIFFCFVLVFTYADHIVNATLYDYGLEFSYGWANPWWTCYFFLYQIAIASLMWNVRDWRFLMVTEAFVLTSTQDLVFYAVWQGAKFPVGDWTWMSYYSLAGVWTTLHQFILSLGSISLAVTFCYGVKHVKCHLSP